MIQKYQKDLKPVRNGVAGFEKQTLKSGKGNFSSISFHSTRHPESTFLYQETLLAETGHQDNASFPFLMHNSIIYLNRITHSTMDGQEAIIFPRFLLTAQNKGNKQQDLLITSVIHRCQIHQHIAYLQNMYCMNYAHRYEVISHIIPVRRR